MHEYIITSKIEIDPETLAKIFWEMDDIDQSEFFNCLGETLSAEELQTQMWYVRSSTNLSESGKKIMNMFAGE